MNMHNSDNEPPANSSPPSVSNTKRDDRCSSLSSPDEEKDEKDKHITEKSPQASSPQSPPLKDTSHEATTKMSSSDKRKHSTRKCHPLYLHSHGRPRSVPICFSNGMDRRACEEYHRNLDLEDKRTEDKKAKKEKLKRRVSSLGTAFRRSSTSSALARCSSTLSTMSGHSNSSVTSSASVQDKGKKPRSGYTVEFSDDVTVYPTPHKSSYPSSVHKSIWLDVKAISREISRNKLEFAHDGCDWTRATEENGMVLRKDGGLVHPVHVYGLKQTTSLSSSRFMTLARGFGGSSSATRRFRATYATSA